jgi:dipeptidyl aminopeptidase/acylaminoacyl peptidase
MMLEALYLSFAREPVRKGKAVYYKASEYQTIECWLLRPTNFKNGKKYPAVLYIHGGQATI